MKSFKIYLFSLFCVTLISLGIFILILFNIDPKSSDILTISAFFASFYVFFVGILTLIGFYIRVAYTNKEIFFAHFSPAFRQSALMGLIIITLLMMKTLDVLNWWDAITVSLAIILTEMYFQTRPLKSPPIC